MAKKNHPLLQIDYPQLFLQETIASPAPRKGERTKQSLIWACAKLLNKIGYQELRVSDVCEVANVSTAAFYLYFKNKTEITRHTLEGFSTAIFNVVLSGGPSEDDNKKALYNSNLAWLKITRLNSGLMRCILQVSFIIPEFAEYYDNHNSNYILRVAKNIAKRADIPELKAQMLVFALSSMTDEFTRRLLSEVDSPLDVIVKNKYSSETDLAEFLSDLWFKAIYT